MIGAAMTLMMLIGKSRRMMPNDVNRLKKNGEDKYPQ